MEIEFNTTDNATEGKISVLINGNEAGFIKYKWMDSKTINAYSTLVLDEYRDKKLGMPLFNQLVNLAKEKTIKIYPTCPFIVKMFARMPELNELLADDYNK